MTVADVLQRLDGTRARGARWSARCPAHADKSPSLSISEGERAVLLKCWAGCSLSDICGALGLKPQDLFFDALDADPQKRRAAAQDRERRRQAAALAARKEGRHLDALRRADELVRSRRGLDIRQWSDQRLHDELNRLADAYALLDTERL